MTQLQITHLPFTSLELERLRLFHTGNTVDVVIPFEDVLSEFYREALRHTRTVEHTPDVVIRGPRTLTITGVC